MMMPLASTRGISGAIPGYPVQTPGVNFTSVLRAAFGAKAALKTLVKLTLGRPQH